jgi:hypothetical protein
MMAMTMMAARMMALIGVPPGAEPGAPEPDDDGWLAGAIVALIPVRGKRSAVTFGTCGW